MSRFSCFYVFCLFFYAHHSGCASDLFLNDTEVRRIVINRADYKTIVDVCSQQITEPFLLEQVTFDADVVIQENELRYLVELHKNTIVSPQELANSISYLFKKNKFVTITCTVQPGKHRSCVHFDLCGLWIFQKLKIKGIFIGKDTYQQYYMLDSGDIFDDDKHNHSVKKILEIIKAEGYCGAHIDEKIERNDNTKTVCVTLTLNKGSRYTINNDIGLILYGTKSHPEDIPIFKKKLQRFYLKNFVGVYYTKETLNKETCAFKQYLAKKGYPFATVELKEHVDSKHKRIDLTFKIDLQNKKEFLFTGNTFFSSGLLSESMLVFGQSTWLLPASILAEEIEGMYKKKGFFDIDVEATEESDACYFTIDEGARYIIKKITFKGVEHFDHHYLRKKFFSSSMRSKWYDQDRLEKSIDCLLSYYFQQGFWSASLLQQEFNCIGKKNEYEVVITLDECERSYVSSVYIDSDEFIPLRGPLRKVSKETIQPCTVHLIQNQKQWIWDYLKKKDFTDVHVQPDIVQDGSDVMLTWKVDVRRAHVDFGKTVLVEDGNFPFEYVLRELQYKDGDCWDRQRLKDSLLKLKRWDLFDHIYFYPDSELDANGKRAIILKLKQDDPFELRMRGGIGLINMGRTYKFRGVMYTAGGTFLYRNPTNRADLFRLELDFSRTQQVMQAAYLRPWVFNMPLDGLFQVYANKFKYPGLIHGQRNLYSVLQQGFLASLTHKRKRAYFTGNIGVEWMKTKISDEKNEGRIFNRRVARAINFEPELLDKKIPYFYYEPTLYVNYLDDQLYPTHGSLTVLSVKGMVPIGKVNAASYFVKLLAEQSFFVPMRSWVFALRGRAGYIIHRHFRNIMPSERFYLGGAHSIRGYDTDMCPPLGKLLNDEGEIEFVPQGGKAMLQGTVELRFPLYKNLGGVVFQDCGYLSGGLWPDMLKGDLLAATGVGLRYKTPIGPLCFDIAVKWLKRESSLPRYAWFLTFGHAF
ncbi:BamA/TamA family outer membrane protein [Candidatus Dependentiae bacterium]|nr:BamA/TamA family outer membrane protein [Candidatus Dependentiae bacterium]